MATSGKQPRSSYFSPVELEILMTAYAESEHIFLKRSNTVAAAKERELVWQKIADRVNACNPTGTKRTWQQLKMKYKNVVQTANRKKAEARKTGGCPPPPPLTEAEKMAFSQNSGRPIAEGISGGSSSDPPTPQDTGAYIKVTDDGVICLVESSAITDLHAEDGEDTLSAATVREDAERPVESHAGNYNEEEGPSTSTEQLTSLPVKQLYKVYLQAQINKFHLEMDHIRLQITKTKMEIQMLDHQLKEIKKTS
ncbi:uncharacterized protein LOC115540858 isoform X2 [Gadus morhua]|uniref:uncharacterized protein LOC115540858 isoform X2 n=1 Tax=Gadus morhua TaxID=8049 RepID=UPI0011B5A35B|nr:uncharacterized protein LOC115540858 isoform X2 [Gadus morhua]